ncbi:MAG: methionine adenosyltransferase [Planctomycetota bacterium]
MAERALITSECVSMGHPDKVADQISDGVLDACLAVDKHSRVACETLVTTGQVVIAGEITSRARVEYGDVARKVVHEIGYNDPALKFDSESCGVMVCVHSQSPDISMGVTAFKKKEQGAGDQGMMFGYACTDTPELMPYPIMAARRMMNRLAELRFAGRLGYIRPDSKCQVTGEYVDGRLVRVHTVVLSTQHGPEVEQSQIRADMIKHVIKQVIEPEYLDAHTVYHINPTGRFVTGGPHGDTGLTGRKIICDTYGGVGSHGGGAFSGKDPSKVDRSAAYAMRHIAKNIVKAGLARRCEVQVSYAIGLATPIAIHVDTEGTGKMKESELVKLVRKHFPLKPAEIISYYDLLRPIYKNTARFGHFGVAGGGRTWEKTEVAKKL